MSFDLFVQGLHEGDAAPLPQDVFDTVIAPYLVPVNEDGHLDLRTPDGGSAELYAPSLDEEVFTGFMLSGFSAGQVLDLVAERGHRGCDPRRGLSLETGRPDAGPERGEGLTPGGEALHLVNAAAAAPGSRIRSRIRGAVDGVLRT